MTATAPTMMNAAAFDTATRPSSIFKRHRGRHLTRIDRALEDWRDGLCAPDQKVAILIRVLRACRGWLHAKGAKETPNAEFRRAGVKTLADQAFARLQFEIFHERKASHGPTPVQPLQGGYAHERSTYVASGKTQAISGSTASALIKNQAEIPGLNVGGKTFNQLTQAEFDHLVRTFAPGQMFETEVVFLKKQDRIGKLIIIEDGILWDGPTSKLDTGDVNQGGFPYVIDAYGNMYSTDHHEQGRNLPAHQRFNHSSFNAGKDVICAGIVQVVDGRPWCIDNNSGHYKPGRAHLLNALQMLQDCGVNLSTMRCGVKEPSTRHPGRLAFRYYNNAATYLANQAFPPNEEYLDD